MRTNTQSKYKHIQPNGYLESFAWGGRTPSGKIKVWCYCHRCGGYTNVTKNNFVNESTRSCGCLRRNVTGALNRKDITNQQFGRLTAKHPTQERRDGKVVWFCICKCGNTTNVVASSLTSGSTKSCGCLARNVTIETHTKDITRMRFGRLVAIVSTRNIGSQGTVWNCQCDCGNTCLVGIGSLTSGGTKSCGCILKEMIGENSPHWNPNLTDEERETRRLKPENKDWIQAVFERDNYTCQCCGERGGVLNAHHKYNYAQYKELRYVLENGITFCAKCHQIFHKIFGYKNNTVGQVWVFTIIYDSLQEE